MSEAKNEDDDFIIDEYEIRNPLVVMIGIGTYKNLRNLDGIKPDYHNFVNVFEKQFGYSTYYERNNDGSYKLEWTIEEIESFIDKIKRKLKKKKHDSLIFGMSCHGEINDKNQDCILDSNSNSKTIDSIYHAFDGNLFRYLSGKPKIFFIDCCRGEAPGRALTLPSLPSGCSFKGDGDNINYNEIKTHSNDDFYKIYGTTRGDASIDTVNGGYLMRSINKVFRNLHKIKPEPNFDNIRKLVQKNIKKQSTSKYVTQLAPAEITSSRNIFFIPDYNESDDDYKQKPKGLYKRLKSTSTAYIKLEENPQYKNKNNNNRNQNGDDYGYKELIEVGGIKPFLMGDDLLANKNIAYEWFIDLLIEYTFGDFKHGYYSDSYWIDAMYNIIDRSLDDKDLTFRELKYIYSEKVKLAAADEKR